MRSKVWIAALSVFFFLLVFLIINHEFGRRLITGQVVDAETGKPIEGAAVLIDWWESGPGPPGLAGSRQLEWKETLTDAQGHFTVPRYSTLLFGKQFSMAVYRKGYVCWSSQMIFPTNKPRGDFNVNNGVRIVLEPFKDEYSKEDHAMFTVHWSPKVHASIYYNLIKDEEQLWGEIVRKNKEN